MPDFRVALLGQGFMGKAHSNAYCQAPHFYDLPYRIRRTLLCGRDTASLASMAQRWGWEETSTDWRSAIDRKDIDAVDIALPNHLHGPAAIAAARGRQDRPLRKAARAVARRSAGDGEGRARRADAGVVQLPARAGRRLRAPADRRRPPRHDLPLQRRLQAAVGRRHLARRQRGRWIPRSPDPASRTTC